MEVSFFKVILNRLVIIRLESTTLSVKLIIQSADEKAVAVLVLFSFVLLRYVLFFYVMFRETSSSRMDVCMYVLNFDVHMYYLLPFSDMLGCTDS